MHETYKEFYIAKGILIQFYSLIITSKLSAQWENYKHILFNMI